MAGWLHFQYADDCQAANPTYGRTAPYGCNNNWGNIGTSTPADFSQIGTEMGSRYCYRRIFPPPPPPPPSPPPSYIKLAADGECQGWSLTPSVCYPNAGYCSTAKDCQDMCDQSDKCGATTFLQSFDSCATRARARAAQASLTRPTSAS